MEMEMGDVEGGGISTYRPFLFLPPFWVVLPDSISTGQPRLSNSTRIHSSASQRLGNKFYNLIR